MRWRSQPERIPLNRRFDLEVAVFEGVDDTNPMTDVDLWVDARMPEHRHGMNLVPRVSRTDKGRFLVTGLLFHMPGRWEVHFDITREGITERAQMDVNLD